MTQPHMTVRHTLTHAFTHACTQKEIHIHTPYPQITAVCLTHLHAHSYAHSFKANDNKQTN